jgi:hypothetical protein
MLGKHRLNSQVSQVYYYPSLPFLMVFAMALRDLTRRAACQVHCALSVDSGA